MNNPTPDHNLLDRVAIAISGLCALHCLLLPVILSVTPLFADSLLGSDQFHRWLLIPIIPISLIAFVNGHRRHRDRRIWPPAGIGLGLLMISAVFGVDGLGHLMETVITVIGSVTLVYAHWLNFRGSAPRLRMAGS